MIRKPPYWIGCFVLAVFLAATGCQKAEEKSAPPPAEPAPAASVSPLDNLPLGLDKDSAQVPRDNSITGEKVELGRLLYFDGRLSRDGTISCASCHNPKHGWTDEGPTSTGIRGQKGGRRAPTVLNRLFSTAQFWDGRAASLEEQAKGPIQNPIEMGFTHEEAVARFSKIAEYSPYFEKAFGTPEVTIDRIAQAIATFERTVVTGDSPVDRWQRKGEETAVSESVKRGLQVFNGKARCITCHAGFNFTDERFHNLGVGMDKEKPDLGRYDVTKQDADKGAFKTPGLRNLKSRAPYMHDGSEKTLETVVDFYDKGGLKNPRLDIQMKPLGLTPDEKKDLIAFLDALNGSEPQVVIPEVFPGGWKPGMPVE
ncbi:MAG: cytochrome-c peroxidase [Bdellovibrionota bacterium]